MVFERTSVGLGVHARSVMACGLDRETGEIEPKPTAAMRDVWPGCYTWARLWKSRCRPTPHLDNEAAAPATATDRRFTPPT